MSKRIPIFILALSMLFTSAYAVDISTPGTGSSTAKVSQIASVINVTVPTSLPVTVDSNNEVTVSSDAKIINNSFGPIKVSNIQLNRDNSWTLVEYNTNFKAYKVGLKQFGFQLQGTPIQSNGVANLDGFTVINGGSELPITYNAKTAVQNQAITQDLGRLIFVISWDNAESTGVYGVVPANVTDYYTFTDDTATTGGWKVGLNSSFISALQSNSTYMDWIPGAPLPNPGSIYNEIHVTSMHQMFYGKPIITRLDLSLFDTSNVKSMRQMFTTCTDLTYINVSSFNTSNVIDMNQMLSGCKFTSIDVSSFNTISATDISSMFSNNPELTSINVSSFNTSNVISINHMFYNCPKLTSISLLSFNTANVTNMSYMFYNCSGLKNIYISSFDTSKVINMSRMFSGCSLLTNIDTSSFNTSSVNIMTSMFNGCQSLTNVDLSSFNTSNVTDMGIMFNNCKSLTLLDLSSFDTSKATNVSSMFKDCTGITNAYAHTQADADKLNTSLNKAVNVNFVVKP